MRSRLLCLRLPNSGLPEFGTLSRPKSDKTDFGWARARKAAAWILVEAKAPTYGCGKQSPPLHCFRIVIYNERCNSNVSSWRGPPTSSILGGVGDGAAPCLFLSFYRDLQGPAEPPFLARPTFVEERLERRHRGLVGREILRDLLVEMRGADVELVRRRIFSHEVGDLVHFRDPSVGLWRHLRQAALEPRQHLRLAALQLGEQRIRRAAARRR